MSTKLDLRQIIGQIYRMTPADEGVEFERIFRIRRETYRDEMAAQARRIGCTQAAARARTPSGASLELLRRESEQDARSIAQTWNQDVMREIARLYERNPRGNRYFYYHHMEQWAEERGVWKDAQITAATVGFAKSLAGQDFVSFNNFSPTYRFTGPAAKCDDCIELMAAGVVPASVKRANETPLHVGCLHEWLIAALAGGANCAELWVG